MDEHAHALATAAACFDDSDFAVSLADAGAPDHPLVYVNPAFCRLVGRRAAECLGRNCRFLQGPDTAPASVQRLRRGAHERTLTAVPLLNYRGNGERFRNAVVLGPLACRGARDGPKLFFGLQWDLDRHSTMQGRSRYGTGAAADETELDDCLQRFSRIAGLVADASLRHQDPADPFATLRRLVAVGRPVLYPPHGRLPNWTRAGSLLRYLFEPVKRRASFESRLDGADDIVAMDAASPLALAVHELGRVTELVRAADPDAEVAVSCGTAGRAGRPFIDLRWHVSSPGGPPPVPEPVECRNAVAIVLDVVGSLGGRVVLDKGPDQLHARVQLPNRNFARGSEPGDLADGGEPG